MISELRAKSQITVPREIVAKLGLSEGDKFEVLERDGAIYFVPVVVYPKRYVEDLEHQVAEARELLAKGELRSYETAEALLTELHAEAGEES
jgi:AbrB family looped-hinge helix DNA binding protein